MQTEPITLNTEVGIRCKGARGIADAFVDADTLGCVNRITRDVEARKASIVTVQLLPRILDLLPSFLRAFAVLRRSLQPLYPNRSGRQVHNHIRDVNAQLCVSTCSTRACHCCILQSICAICRRGRLRGLKRIPCRPLTLQLEVGRSRGAK